MQSYDKNKRKDKTARTIVLCFCVIVLTSIFTIKANIDKVTRNAENIQVTKEAPAASTKPVEKQEARTDESASAESEESEDVVTEIPVVDSQNQAPASGDFTTPMNMAAAKVVKEYSMDMVVYNKTLDQYMTHPGIDIQAEGDSEVLAVASGIVTDIYDDDAYGITIEITHNNGYVTRYCNLSTEDLVEKGDKVNASQVISSVGKSAMYESADKPHLHFEILKGQELLNPSDFINF